MGLVCFKSDNIAKSTCEWFTNILQKPPQDFRKTLAGGHLRPLGIQVAKYVINLFDKPLIESIQEQNKAFEHNVIHLLEELKEKSR